MTDCQDMGKGDSSQQCFVADLEHAQQCSMSVMDVTQSLDVVLVRPGLHAISSVIFMWQCYFKQGLLAMLLADRDWTLLN